MQGISLSPCAFSRQKFCIIISELSCENSATSREFSPHFLGDCSRQRRIRRRRLESVRPPLNLPVVGYSAPNPAFEGRIDWLAAIANGGLDGWRQEGRRSAGANMGLVESGRSGNLAECDALPRRCHPAVRIGYPTRNAARPDVSDAFEMFQNPNCKHANNGMLSPVDFKTRQQKLNEAGVRETWGTLPACHPDVANARAAIRNGAKCSRRRTGIRQRLRPPPAGRSHRPAAGCRWSPERCRQSQRRCCDRLGGPRPPR